jgi:hypothetical protein
MSNTILNKLRFFGAYALLAASSVLAQAGQKVVANVPFNFMARNQHFAAGSYTLTPDISRAIVLIRGEEDSLFALSISTESRKISSCARLIFNRYGDQYFLSEVWPAGTSAGRQLLPSKAELEIARNGAKPEIVALLVSAGRQHTPSH